MTRPLRIGANPTVNANGPIYGALEASADYMPVLDPVSHAGEPGAGLTVRDPEHAGRPRVRAMLRPLAVLG